MSTSAFGVSAALRLVHRRRCYLPTITNNHSCWYVSHHSRSFSETSKTRIEQQSELQGYKLDDAGCNVTSDIANRVGTNLHLQPRHPLNTIKEKIQSYWGSTFEVYDDISPIASTYKNFDVLRIPADHVSRSKSDTYYLNDETVLRTHTSTHQIDILSSGTDRFLVVGDVYRRDEIDQSHYPVFHQMEGVKIFKPDDRPQGSSEISTELIEADLKQGLEGLAAHLFGHDAEMRWVDAYFPFTHPSFELEIYFNDEWLEVLGCGVIHPDIMERSGRPEEQGWAFGLGLERLAMVLFGIPDIRLFWTKDDRFHRQFRNTDDLVRFQPYSKYPPCHKDISFWIPGDFHVNDLNEVVRSVAGDLVEEVQLIDHFENPKTKRTSHCYRISYRSMDRSLTNEEIDDLQGQVRDLSTEKLGIELR